MNCAPSVAAGSPSSSGARRLLHIMAAPAPPVGASMLVAREPYTSLILSGLKTHELRPKRVLGKKYLACSTTHQVKALLYFGESRLLSEEDYKASSHEHHCRQLKKPYKTTWSTKIVRVIPLQTHVLYRAKPGATCRAERRKGGDRLIDGLGIARRTADATIKRR